MIKKDFVRSIDTKIRANQQTLIFKDGVVSEWEQSSVYENYPYAGIIMCHGVTNEHIPIVNFSMVDATSGIFAPIAESGTGYVKIYASEQPATGITIPSIICENGGGGN